MSDEIRLVLPAEEDFRPVAHLVVGGLGARHDLTFEDLDDLQVAVEALLSCRADDGDVEVTLEIDGGLVQTTIGPLPSGEVAAFGGDGSQLGLHRVLETVCDTVEVDERDAGAWVVLQKRVNAATRKT
jgi:hypothetical protein